MTRTLRAAFAPRAALFAVGLLSCWAAGAAGPAQVVAPRASVAGASQAEWSVRWWQWASAFDYEESPVADRTGELCASGQEGAVWFLAGIYGSAPVKRRCVVPAGKWLFFPIVNYRVFPNPAMGGDCADVTATARALTDSPEELVLFIDDVPVHDLQRHRQATPSCFELPTSTGDTIYPTAGNGYYVMLKPLPPGKHVLKWGAILDSIRQAVVYEIEVGAAPGEAL